MGYVVGKSYCKVYRSIIGHPILWERPVDKTTAFVWMVLTANWQDDGSIKRGELPVSRSYLASVWGWSEGKVLRYLRRLEKAQMVTMRSERVSDLFLKSNSKYGFFGTNPGTDFVPNLTIVKILNYDTYQSTNTNNGTDLGTDLGTAGGTDPGTDPGTEKKEEEKNYKKKKKRTSTRPPKPVASHDPEVLKELLSEINMPEFERQYGPQGLDTFACFDDFTDYVLNGSAKNPNPNPSGWVAPLSRAFHDSCKRALRSGRHICKPETKKDSSLAERLAKRGWK